MATYATTVGLCLEPWEAAVFDRYKIHSGRMLVVGCGWGRESIAAARRGLTVVGVDTNKNVVRVARRLAKDENVPAFLHQGDFLELPYAGSSFDYILLSGIMYSEVAGAHRRQVWLQDLGRLLKPDGLVMLNFVPFFRTMSPRTTVCRYLNRFLSKLPGTNAFYQPGDDCAGGRYLHSFQNEAEIRDEILRAGMIIKELNWDRAFAVVTPSGGLRSER